MESLALFFKALMRWCWERSKDDYTKPAFILSLLPIAIIWCIFFAKNQKAMLPPGPWGLPLIGNLPFLDPDLHRCFADLSRKYGPIMKVHLGSKLCIVFTSVQVAKEVLKDHDANFADRDVPAAAFVATYGASDMAFAPYGEEWRMMRKVCVRELLSYERLEALYGLRRREARDMVNKIHSKIGSSIDIGELVVITMFNVVTGMMWGNTLDGEERHRVTNEFRQVAQKMVSLIGEPNISDFYPLLGRFDIQRKERRMKEIVIWFDQIFEFVIDKRRRMEKEEDEARKDKENRDFLQVLLELMHQGEQKTLLRVTHVKALFVDMTVAGTKTTSTTVEWAIAELLNQPELMKKAQAELDQVVGLNNMVEEKHLSKLPYLDAIVKEVLRLHPTSPLLIPRRSKESCRIGGYLIPKGAVVFVNAWAMQRDPKNWNDPLMFQPERFFNSSNEWDYNGNDFRFLPFGSGRRMCVGVPIAEKMVSYLLASLIHSFNWDLPPGTKLDMSEEFGIELKKKNPLFAIPTPRLIHSSLYE